MAHFLSFVAFATAIAVAPSPNTFLTLRNTVIGGRARGLWTTLGIGFAGATQGVLAAAGLGAIIARSEPVLQTIRWLGVAYLVYLGVMALRTAIKARGEGWAMTPEATPRSPRRSFRQGFLCNITNPKVLAFNLAVLPQFAGPGTGMLTLLAHALTIVGTIVLLAVVGLATRARDALARPLVNRGVEGCTGVVKLGFAGGSGWRGLT